jgi:hypothetical protein
MSPISTGQGPADHALAAPESPELVETKVGDALVYFRVERRLDAVDTQGIRAVAGPAIPKDALDAAAEVAREAVRLFAARLSAVGEALQPTETGIEFSLSFAATGKATIVPVILTGEATGQVALKVSAKWTKKEKP